MSLRHDTHEWPLSGPPAPSIRRRLEDTIEALIAELDALDGDADLEDLAELEELDEDDDPAEDSDAGEDDGTGEPSLGWTMHPGQNPSLCGGTDDREKDAGDGKEASWPERADQSTETGLGVPEDDEPWLGAPEAKVSVPLYGIEWWSPAPRRSGPERETRTLDGSQVGWAAGSRTDGERDAGEEPEAVNEDGGDVQDEPHDAVDEDTGIGDRDAMMAEDFPSIGDLAGTYGWRSEHGKADRHLANAFAMRALAIKERREPFTDPTRLPRHYSIRLVGNCLEPKVKGGQRMVFDTEQPARPGDTVVVWFKPDKVPFGFTRATVKHLAAQDAVSVTVETLNPPRAYRFALDAVWALHRHSHLV